eukprot:1158162-Pelagomonas_calceolata.AAC.2
MALQNRKSMALASEPHILTYAGACRHQPDTHCRTFQRARPSPLVAAVAAFVPSPGARASSALSGKTTENSPVANLMKWLCMVSCIASPCNSQTSCILQDESTELRNAQSSAFPRGLQLTPRNLFISYMPFLQLQCRSQRRDGTHWHGCVN